ncbi:unnamed protein product [Lactuca virosa]|uniref:Uncharacterized protein n=1 Tax=Lactuca virosa TaxID=75947 RepID=A0AAU9NQF5_9ASTR|nr:unnamed protein product [Lactuca virosa]
MAGFHPHGDPYFPNEGNVGWLEEEPEDDHPIPLDDHHAEGFSDSSDSEPEVNNLPQVGQAPNLNPQPAFQGPTPLWATNLNRWSDEQGQPLPYYRDRSFYDLSRGGSADRARPVMIRRIARNVEQGRAAIDRVMEIDANSGVNTVRIRHLEDAVEGTRRTNETLRQQLAASRTEILELRVRQRAHERHLQEVVPQLADMGIIPRNSRRR